MLNAPGPLLSLVLFVLFVLLGRILLGVISAAIRRTVSRNEPMSKPPEATKQKPPWIWIFVLVLVAWIMFMSMPRQGVGGQAGIPMPWWIIFIPMGVTVLVLTGVVLVRWLRIRDPASIRAFRRADEGDLDGAIRELTEAIEIQGPTAVRLNNLGCLLIKQESHGESLKVFLEAERVGGRFVHFFRANQAVALRKLGRPEEALPIIEEARERMPKEMVFACHHCLILADLGRFDEARVQLRAAESIPRVLVFPKSARDGRAKLLKECQDWFAVKSAEGVGDWT